MPHEEIVYHPLNGYSLCYGGGYENIFTAAVPGPEHGTLVTCRVCGRTGVIPDEGHELEFLPPGTERAPGGGFFLRFRPSGDTSGLRVPGRALASAGSAQRQLPGLSSG